MKKFYFLRVLLSFFLFSLPRLISSFGPPIVPISVPHGSAAQEVKATITASSGPKVVPIAKTQGPVITEVKVPAGQPQVTQVTISGDQSITPISTPATGPQVIQVRTVPHIKIGDLIIPLPPSGISFVRSAYYRLGMEDLCRAQGAPEGFVNFCVGQQGEFEYVPLIRPRSFGIFELAMRQKEEIKDPGVFPTETIVYYKNAIINFSKMYKDPAIEIDGSVPHISIDGTQSDNYVIKSIKYMFDAIVGHLKIFDARIAYFCNDIKNTDDMARVLDAAGKLKGEVVRFIGNGEAKGEIDSTFKSYVDKNWAALYEPFYQSLYAIIISAYGRIFSSLVEGSRLILTTQEVADKSFAQNFDTIFSLINIFFTREVRWLQDRVFAYCAAFSADKVQLKAQDSLFAGSLDMTNTQLTERLKLERQSFCDNNNGVSAEGHLSSLEAIRNAMATIASNYFIYLLNGLDVKSSDAAQSISGFMGAQSANIQKYRRALEVLKIAYEVFSDKDKEGKLRDSYIYFKNYYESLSGFEGAFKAAENKVDEISAYAGILRNLGSLNAEKWINLIVSMVRFLSVKEIYFGKWTDAIKKINTTLATLNAPGLKVSAQDAQKNVNTAAQVFGELQLDLQPTRRIGNAGKSRDDLTSLYNSISGSADAINMNMLTQKQTAFVTQTKSAFPNNLSQLRQIINGTAIASARLHDVLKNNPDAKKLLGYSAALLSDIQMLREASAQCAALKSTDSNYIALKQALNGVEVVPSFDAVGDNTKKTSESDTKVTIADFLSTTIVSYLIIDAESKKGQDGKLPDNINTINEYVQLYLGAHAYVPFFAKDSPFIEHIDRALGDVRFYLVTNSKKSLDDAKAFVKSSEKSPDDRFAAWRKALNDTFVAWTIGKIDLSDLPGADGKTIHPGFESFKNYLECLDAFYAFAGKKSDDNKQSALVADFVLSGNDLFVLQAELLFRKYLCFYVLAGDPIGDKDAIFKKLKDGLGLQYADLNAARVTTRGDVQKLLKPFWDQYATYAQAVSFEKLTQAKDEDAFKEIIKNLIGDNADKSIGRGLRVWQATANALVTTGDTWHRAYASAVPDDLAVLFDMPVGEKAAVSATLLMQKTVIAKDPQETFNALGIRAQPEKEKVAFSTYTNFISSALQESQTQESQTQESQTPGLQAQGLSTGELASTFLLACAYEAYAQWACKNAVTAQPTYPPQGVCKVPQGYHRLAESLYNGESGSGASSLYAALGLGNSAQRTSALAFIEKNIANADSVSMALAYDAPHAVAFVAGNSVAKLSVCDYFIMIPYIQTVPPQNPNDLSAQAKPVFDLDIFMPRAQQDAIKAKIKTGSDLDLQTKLDIAAANYLCLHAYENYVPLDDLYNASSPQFALSLIEKFKNLKVQDEKNLVLLGKLAAGSGIEGARLEKLARLIDDATLYRKTLESWIGLYKMTLTYMPKELAHENFPILAYCSLPIQGYLLSTSGYNDQKIDLFSPTAFVSCNTAYGIYKKVLSKIGEAASAITVDTQKKYVETRIGLVKEGLAAALPTEAYWLLKKVRYLQGKEVLDDTQLKKLCADIEEYDVLKEYHDELQKWLKAIDGWNAGSVNLGALDLDLTGQYVDTATASMRDLPGQTSLSVQKLYDMLKAIARYYELIYICLSDSIGVDEALGEKTEAVKNKISGQIAGGAGAFFEKFLVGSHVTGIAALCVGAYRRDADFDGAAFFERLSLAAEGRREYGEAAGYLKSAIDERSLRDPRKQSEQIAYDKLKLLDLLFKQGTHYLALWYSCKNAEASCGGDALAQSLKKSGLCAGDEDIVDNLLFQATKFYAHILNGINGVEANKGYKDDKSVLPDFKPLDNAAKNVLFGGFELFLPAVAKSANKVAKCGSALQAQINALVSSYSGADLKTMRAKAAVMEAVASKMLAIAPVLYGQEKCRKVGDTSVRCVTNQGPNFTTGLKKSGTESGQYFG